MRKMFKTVALTAALLLFTAGKTKADVNVNEKSNPPAMLGRIE